MHEKEKEKEKKKTKDSKKYHTEHLHTSKIEFENSILEFQSRLRDVTATSRFDFLQRLAAFIFSNKGCYQQGMTIFDQIGDDLLGIMKDMEDAKAEFLDNKEKDDHRISLLVTQTQKSGLEKQGYLYKISHKKMKKSLKNWNMKWFQLKDGILSWYTKWKDTQPSGLVRLKLCCIKIIHDRPLTFEITQAKPEMRIVVRGLTESDYNEWLETIKNAISYALSKDDDEKEVITPEKKKSGSKLHVESYDLSYYNGGNESFLNKVLGSDEENMHCADCGASNPDWVSINIGSVICIECSGIHRSLGSHISKVRSLKMDSLKKEVQTFLLFTGNSFINDLFEGKIYEESDVLEGKPHPEDSEETKTTYIKDKYILKKYVLPFQTPVSKDLLLRFINNYPHIDPMSAEDEIILNQDGFVLSPDSSPSDIIRKYISLFVRGHFSSLEPGNYVDEENKKNLCHFFAEKADPTLLSFFISNGVKQDVPDSLGRIPLHYAAYSLSMDTCQLLVNKTDIRATDNEGLSPHDFVRSLSNSDAKEKMITFLKEYELSTNPPLSKSLGDIKVGRNRKRSWTLTGKSKDNSRPPVHGVFSKRGSEKKPDKDSLEISRPTTFSGAEQAKTLRLKSRDTSLVALDNLIPKSSDDSKLDVNTQLSYKPPFKRKSRSLPSSPIHFHYDKETEPTTPTPAEAPERKRRLKRSETTSTVHIRQESLDHLTAREFWKKIDESLELSNPEKSDQSRPRPVLKRSVTTHTTKASNDLIVQDDTFKKTMKDIPAWSLDLNTSFIVFDPDSDNRPNEKAPKSYPLQTMTTSENQEENEEKQRKRTSTLPSRPSPISTNKKGMLKPNVTVLTPPSSPPKVPPKNLNK